MSFVIALLSMLQLLRVSGVMKDSSGVFNLLANLFQFHFEDDLKPVCHNTVMPKYTIQ